MVAHPQLLYAGLNNTVSRKCWNLPSAMEKQEREDYFQLGELGRAS